MEYLTVHIVYTMQISNSKHAAWISTHCHYLHRCHRNHCANFNTTFVRTKILDLVNLDYGQIGTQKVHDICFSSVADLLFKNSVPLILTISQALPSCRGPIAAATKGIILCKVWLAQCRHAWHSYCCHLAWQGSPSRCWVLSLVREAHQWSWKLL